MAKETKDPRVTLDDFAVGVGTLLGKAERRWREWGASEKIEQAVADIRDRASALLDEMNAARTTTAQAPPEPPPVPPRTIRKVARKAARKAVKAVKQASKAARSARAKARARR